MIDFAERIQGANNCLSALASKYSKEDYELCLYFISNLGRIYAGFKTSINTNFSFTDLAGPIANQISFAEFVIKVYEHKLTVSSEEKEEPRGVAIYG